MPPKTTSYERNANDLHAFGDALRTLLQVMDQHEKIFGETSWVPKKGREGEASSRAAEVDVLSGPAAHALDAAGIFIEWSPRGTMATTTLNPAVRWRTILTDDPNFPADAIFACCNQALGILRMRHRDAVEHERSVKAKVEPILGAWRNRRRGEPGRHGPIIATAVLTSVTTVAAWLITRMGWVSTIL